MPRTKKTKDLCVGCHDNYYNNAVTSNTGECWSYKSARIARKKFVPIDMRPPWDLPIITTLSCHRKRRHVAVDPKVMR
jgi:hypothetical protein